MSSIKSVKLPNFTKYKELEIKKEDNGKYFTIVNRNVKVKGGHPHTHASTYDEAQRVVDCYCDFKDIGYTYEGSNFVKTGALRLLGLKFFDYCRPRR